MSPLTKLVVHVMENDSPEPTGVFELPNDVLVVDQNVDLPLSRVSTFPYHGYAHYLSSSTLIGCGIHKEMQFIDVDPLYTL
jgi:hypothetical protein